MLLRLCVTGRGHAQPPVSSARRRPGHGDLARPTDRRRTTRAGVLQRGRQRTARSPPSRRQEPRPTSWPPPLTANRLRSNARQAHQDHRNGTTEADRGAHCQAARSSPMHSQHAFGPRAHARTTHDARKTGTGAEARTRRKHAAKPDSASRKQHRPGQQGLHCRAASQAPSSTNGTHDHRRAIRAACSAPGSLSRATGHRIGSGSLHCQAAPQVAFPCATAAVPSSPSARRSATHAHGPRRDPQGARRPSTPSYLE